VAAPPETSRGVSTAPPLAPMPPGHWLLGHLKQRRRDPLRLFSASQQMLGDVVRYRMGYIYVSSSPTLTRSGTSLSMRRTSMPKGRSGTSSNRSSETGS
jgi:hypothetical protein